MLVWDPDRGRHKTDTSGDVPCVRRASGDDLVGGDAVGFGELVRACGFDVPLELAAYDPAADERIAELQMLSPERRLERLLNRGR
jgi:hypothetical protein